jgi:Protein of unknown function (DUF3631)
MTAESDGAALLDSVHTALTKYVKFADNHQPVAVTLWTAATHAIPAWQHATRLIITSPSKRCGKSRLMDIVAGLSFSPLLCADTTTAAVFRSIGNDDTKTPTLIDEADALFGTKRKAEQNEDLRALLNAGWQRDRPSRRCVGPLQIPTDFNTFAMAALAAIGRLPDTIADRAVSIDLKRRGPGEKVARFRIRRDRHQLTELCGELTTWVRSRIEDLTEAEFDMPGVEDRALDAWEPLLAIAAAAGGDWPRKAKAACRVLTAVDADDEHGTRLLIDIKAIFGDTCQSFLASKELVRELRDIEESPWGDEKSDTYLTASKLAKLLKPYGVTPGHNPAKTVRGYTLDSLRDAFARYLRPEPSERPTADADQREQPQDSENDEVSVTRPEPSERTLSDASDTLRTPWDDGEESPKSAGSSHASDNWTVSDGTPERNGTPYGGDYRRPGCVCIGQPKPCYHCTRAASKAGAP